MIHPTLEIIENVPSLDVLLMTGSRPPVIVNSGLALDSDVFDVGGSTGELVTETIGVEAALHRTFPPLKDSAALATDDNAEICRRINAD